MKPILGCFSSVLLLGLSLSACGDGAPPPAVRPTEAPAAEKADIPATPAPAAPKPATPTMKSAVPGTAAPAKFAVTAAKSDKPQTSKEKLLTDLHNRPFKPVELAANPPYSADPFHNNLDIFGPPKSGDAPPPCLLAKYNLEEMKLTAILQATDGPGSLSKAMFIDPTSKGYFLKRGDRMTKNCPVVQRVLSDRVVFEFTEESGPGTTKQVARTIELHPGGDELPVP